MWSCLGSRICNCHAHIRVMYGNPYKEKINKIGVGHRTRIAEMAPMLPEMVFSGGFASHGM